MQARTYTDDDECRSVIESIVSREASSKAIESLAEMLIMLKEELEPVKGAAMPQAVIFELGRLIEFTFQHSKAYQLALELYRGRFQCIGGGDLEGNRRRLKEKQMAPSSGKDQASTPGESDAQLADPPAATDAGDQARALIISQLLKADEATLNYLLHLLDARSRPMPEQSRFSPEQQKRFAIFEAVALVEHQDPLRLDVLHRLLSIDAAMLQRVATVISTPNKSEVVEVMAGLFEKYKNESEVSVHLSNILNWREMTQGGQEFERQLVAGAVAQILQSPETPEALREVVGRCIGELHSQVELFDLTEPEQVREFFSDVIAGLAKGSQPEQASAELPPLPMSEALSDLLRVDAERCLRDLDAQALAILEYHYGLYEPVPGTRTDVDTVPTNEPRKESRPDEAQG